MKKISFGLILTILVSSLFGAQWGLKKPSTHVPSDFSVVKPENELGQKLSVSFSSLTNNGDLSSDYQSGMSLDFLVNCNKSCSLLGQKLNLGLGIGITSMCDDDPEVELLTLGSLGLHIMPEIKMPVDFSFGGGLAHAPGNMGVGMIAFLAMDFYYKLPMCENMSLGFQYKQYVDPEDGELNFSKLGTMGLALRVDG